MRKHSPGGPLGTAPVESRDLVSCRRRTGRESGVCALRPGSSLLETKRRSYYGRLRILTQVEAKGWNRSDTRRSSWYSRRPGGGAICSFVADETNGNFQLNLGHWRQPGIRGYFSPRYWKTACFHQSLSMVCSTATSIGSRSGLPFGKAIAYCCGSKVVSRTCRLA
jgi:hypothetical protein